MFVLLSAKVELVLIYVSVEIMANCVLLMTRNVISINLAALKVQKVPPGVDDGMFFSLNATHYSAKEGWARVYLPPSTFDGKGRI